MLNAKVNLAFYFVSLLLAFFSRRIFLRCLGEDFIGFTGTVSNLLGFLNLAELGVASAVGYVLYKPLYDHNKPELINIISVFGYIYRKIGFLILGSGIVLSLFLPLIYKNAGIDMGVVYLAFYSFLTTSLIGYFANYKQTLLAADQKNYLVTAYFQTASVIRILIQMAVASYTGNYVLWILIELTFGILHSLILNWKINKVYPWLKSDIRKGKELLKEYRKILTYTKQLFIHKIASFIQFQTNPFIIYAFTNLASVAAYGNYIMIINSLLTCVNKFLGSTEAAIGNLVASGDMKKILGVFRELTAIRYFIAGCEVFGIAVFSREFISLWVGKEFLLSDITVGLMIAFLFIMQTRGTNDQFLYAYGLFADVWAAIAEMTVSLAGALVLGYFYGLPGVISGGVMGMLLIVCIWKPIYLYTKGFKNSLWRYWLLVGKNVCLIAASVVAAYWIKQFIFPDSSASILMLGLRAVVVMAIYMLLSFSLFYISGNGMREFTSRIIHQVLKK